MRHERTQTDTVGLAEPEVSYAVVGDSRVPGNEVGVADAELGFDRGTSISGDNLVPQVAVGGRARKGWRWRRRLAQPNADAICLAEPKVGQTVVGDSRVPGDEVGVANAELGLDGGTVISGRNHVPLVTVGRGAGECRCGGCSRRLGPGEPDSSSREEEKPQAEARHGEGCLEFLNWLVRLRRRQVTPNAGAKRVFQTTGAEDTRRELEGENVVNPGQRC